MDQLFGHVECLKICIFAWKSKLQSWNMLHMHSSSQKQAQHKGSAYINEAVHTRNNAKNNAV